MRLLHALSLALFFLTLAWSFWGHAYTVTWFLEAAPALVVLLMLACTFHRFQFSNLVYVLILVHCVILFVGAKYTYARVPLFDWLKDFFDLSRNNYDKVGHFAQGFVPAFVLRELLVRFEIVNKKIWIPVFVVSMCLAFSALYELFEWWVAIAMEALTGNTMDDFLGTQGYVWDTQSDMFFALLGACCMVFFFADMHDRSINKLLPQKDCAASKKPSNT